jgi:hypothetical protein
MISLTKHNREIFDPIGSNISQLKRYVHIKGFKVC